MFALSYKVKVLSFGKFQRNLAVIKIVQIRHLEGHPKQNNQDLKIVCMQK